MVVLHFDAHEPILGTDSLRLPRHQPDNFTTVAISEAILGLCGGAAVASLAREVGRPLYGEGGKFKDATGRLGHCSPLPFLP